MLLRHCWLPHWQLCLVLSAVLSAGPALDLGVRRRIPYCALAERFYADFPAHPDEAVYKYACSSSLKPTQMSCPKGSINQIPSECVISGDIRLTPFYEVDAVIAAMKRYEEAIWVIVAGGKRYLMIGRGAERRITQA